MLVEVGMRKGGGEGDGDGLGNDGGDGLARAAPCRVRIDEDHRVLVDGLEVLGHPAGSWWLAVVGDLRVCAARDRDTPRREGEGEGWGAHEVRLWMVILGRLVVNGLVAVGWMKADGVPRRVERAGRRNLVIGKVGGVDESGR